MIIRNFYVNLLLRLISIVALAIIAGYVLATTESVLIIVICTLMIVLLIISTVSYLNTTNEKIRFFFDAVRNDDSNLSFPVNKGNRALSELYTSMNKVNMQIQQLKIENSQKEKYFSELIEHLATGIITFNSKGFILNANSAAKRLLSTDNLTHLQQIEHNNFRLYQAISNIKPFKQKLISFPSTPGNIQLTLKASSVKAGNEELIIVSINDIKNELDEKELDSWLKLIRVLMHEIMNSLTPIISLSENLTHIFNNKGKAVSPDDVTQDTIANTIQGLSVINEQVKGLMSFVESYRRLTRIPEPEKKYFKINDLFKRVHVLYKSLENNERMELSVNTGNPDLEIFADENLITQVIINLLKNAIQANENNPEGTIRISCSTDNAGHAKICVADNGPGISEDKIEEIFVPFFITRKEGTGIGLSISKQIMRVHGGNLTVRSKPGKETIFCLTFDH